MTPPNDLSPGERQLGSWPARSPSGDHGSPATGDLVLTNRRLLFLPKRGLFGRSGPPEAGRSLPLEGIGGAAPRRSEMRIGYGDRMILEGIEVDGTAYELGREASSRGVLEAIAAARESRRNELGLSRDTTPCRSCGRWVAAGTALCAGCARSIPSG